MKIEYKNNKKKETVFLIVVSILAVLALAIFFTHHYQVWPFAKQAAEEVKQNDIDATNNQTGEAKPDDSAKTDDSVDTTPPTSNSIPVTIVDASQYGDQFEIRAYADMVEDGACTFTFTKGTASFKKESVATVGPSTSSCKTVDISISDFGATGDWQLSVAYKSDSGKYSGSTTKTITIK